MFFFRAACLAIIFIIPLRVVATEQENLYIDQLRTVFERSGEQVDITQFFMIVRRESETEKPEIKFNVQLPVDARNARPADKDDSVTKIETGRAVTTLAAGKQAMPLSVRFSLPIRDEKLRFEQKVGREVRSAQFLTTAVTAETKLSGNGFSEEMPVTLVDGLQAKLITRENVADGHLEVKLTGLRPPPGRAERLFTLIVSLIVMIGGFIYWLLGRKNREPLAK